MPVWPADLPPPATGSLNEQPPSNSMRSQMDKGPDKTRRRTTANSRPITYAMIGDESIIQTLDDFYDEETYSGSIQFDYVHPRTGDACEAKFIDRPQYSHIEGDAWRANVQLEILP